MPTFVPPTLDCAGKACLLIVEDESLVAADLEERLVKMGYEVCGIADTCDGATAMASTLRPSLVLMDIHLIGKKDGIEAATIIRKETGIPVVFLTAHADSATLSRIEIAEPFGYALKPFDERELNATIEVALYRYQAESRLKKMERWLATTLGSIGDGVIATDLDGKIKFMNSMDEGMTGWLTANGLGRPVAEIIVLEKNDQRVSLSALLDQALSIGSAIYLDDGHLLVTKNGQRVPIADSISVIRDDGNVVTGWVIIFRDMTALAEAEKERKILENKMQEAQRLESLGMLAGGIAHDFNNLLQVVVGNASLAELVVGESSEEQIKRELPGLLGEIKVAADRGANLCGQMLAYAGRGQFLAQDVDLAQFVQVTTDLLKSTLPKNAKVHLRLLDKIPPIHAAPSQLQQIVMNLLINASEALAGKPGVLTVEVGLQHADRQFLSECVIGDELPESNYVFLKVVDTGCGMPPETVSRVFDPFFTTKFQGRGLGLAAVNGIVRGHGGALSVQSVPGEGTTFEILFPPITKTNLVVAPAASVSSEWRSTGRALLVDDEPEVRAVGHALLVHFGFEVDEAEDGSQAVEQISLRNGDYRFVLMDLTMPNMSGQEAF
jgi:PAS domain S-box-containing protein